MIVVNFFIVFDLIVNNYNTKLHTDLEEMLNLKRNRKGMNAVCVIICNLPVIKPGYLFDD